MLAVKRALICCAVNALEYILTSSTAPFTGHPARSVSLPMTIFPVLASVRNLIVVVLIFATPSIYRVVVTVSYVAAR